MMQRQHTTDADHRDAPRPLAGVRVLEYASLVTGPYCGKLLADMGAEVIKAEPPSGDPSRHIGPFPNDIPHIETSALFLYLNLGKLGVTLDIHTPGGRELFRRLAQHADILLEDTAPGTLEQIGLGYASLRQVNPRLIMVSITPFGQTGPYARWKAYDLNSFHSGGEGWLVPSGLSYRLFPDRAPLKMGGHVGDYYCGVAAAVATLGALHARLASGRGQHVDVSKQEAHLNLARRSAVHWPNLRVLEDRKSRGIAYGGVMPCKDGYVEVLAFEDHQWQALMEMMGNPPWADAPGIADPSTRRQHGAEINEHIQAWARQYTRQEIFQKALEVGVPVGPFYAPRDILASQHLRERGFFVAVEHPVAGRYETPHAPFRFSASAWGPQRPAPLLGQHNEALYSGVLGYTHQDLARFRQADVI